MLEKIIIEMNPSIGIKKEIKFIRNELEERIKRYRNQIKKCEEEGTMLVVPEQLITPNIYKVILENTIKTAQLLINGYSIKDIANKLNIEESTITYYIKNYLVKNVISKRKK